MLSAGLLHIPLLFVNRHGKKEFLTLGQRLKYDKKHNSREQTSIVINKEKVLFLFHDFIKRDWCGRTYHSSEEDYAIFAQKHARGIIKPLESSGGNGVEIISTDLSSTGETLYELCKRKNVIIEELILQHEELNRMYPKAINTVRILTNSSKVIGAALRMGADGGEVDNAHAGGIYAEIDIETGIVVSTGHRYTDERFIKHPYTGTIIPGFQIPMWNRLLELVSSASRLVENMGLIGWDIAVTPDGPTIVEVNNWPGVELIQSPLGHGLRNLL